jgi:hypothetical protein
MRILMTGVPATIEPVSFIESWRNIGLINIDTNDSTFKKLKRIKIYTYWIFLANSVLDVTPLHRCYGK